MIPLTRLEDLRERRLAGEQETARIEAQLRERSLPGSGVGFIPLDGRGPAPVPVPLERQAREVRSHSPRIRAKLQDYSVQLTDAKWNDHIHSLNATYAEKTRLLREASDQIKWKHDELTRKQNDYAKQRHDLAQREASVGMRPMQNLATCSDDDVLEINAGGEQIIWAKRGTLTQFKGTTLEAIFSERWEKELLRDDDGRIFLDVNATCFKAIVDYLAQRKISPKNNPPDPPAVGLEHEIFLDRLIRRLGLSEEIYNGCPIDSKIMIGLEQFHMNSLFKWLVEANGQGNLQLLYRASRDGWSASNFHHHCDYRGPTVTLIQTTEGYVFGGYADTPWTNKGTFAQSPKAFIFGLKCHSGIAPVKMKQLPDAVEYAVWHGSGYGPIFGGGHDICVTSNIHTSYTNIGHTYQCPEGQDRETFLTGSLNFLAKEVEVFSVVPVKSTDFRIPTYDTDAALNDRLRRFPLHERWQTMTFDEFPDQVRQALNDEQRDLISKWELVSLLEHKFNEESHHVNYFVNNPFSVGDNERAAKHAEEIVTFNISGKKIAVKRSTIEQCPESQLIKEVYGSQSSKQTPVRIWNYEQVAAWAEGLSIEVRQTFFKNKINGNELLALDREDLKEIGITRPASRAIIAKAIQRLKNERLIDNIVFIEHDEYCMIKIIDQLRMRAMQQWNDSTPLQLPHIRPTEKKKFKIVVKYYFPDHEERKLFLK